MLKEPASFYLGEGTTADGLIVHASHPHNLSIHLVSRKHEIMDLKQKMADLYTDYNDSYTPNFKGKHNCTLIIIVPTLLYSCDCSVVRASDFKSERCVFEPHFCSTYLRL